MFSNILTIPQKDTLSLNQKEFPLNWHMSAKEKSSLIYLLEQIRPEIAIEIGTLRGGSLQAISKFTEKVYSIDINPEVERELNGRFQNVDFLTGDSKTIIPTVLREIKREGKKLEFVLIDGDHSTEGVRNDINAILKYYPIESPLYIVFHDSFNPNCRKGIMTANYRDNLHVHYIDLDFLSGETLSKNLANYREMFGGFALIVMSPEKRTTALEIVESQKALYDSVYSQSSHYLLDKLPILKKTLKYSRNTLKKFIKVKY